MQLLDLLATGVKEFALQQRRDCVLSKFLKEAGSFPLRSFGGTDFGVVHNFSNFNCRKLGRICEPFQFPDLPFEPTEHLKFPVTDSIDDSRETFENSLNFWGVLSIFIAANSNTLFSTGSEIGKECGLISISVSWIPDSEIFVDSSEIVIKIKLNSYMLKLKFRWNRNKRLLQGLEMYRFYFLFYSKSNINLRE